MECFYLNTIEQVFQFGKDLALHSIKTVGLKNCNDAKSHYNFHLNRKLDQQNIIERLIGSTNMNSFVHLKTTLLMIGKSAMS